MNEDLVKRESSTVVGARVDVRALAIWCQWMERAGIPARTASQAVGSALECMLEVLRNNEQVGRELPTLDSAITWLESKGLMQARMHGRSGKKLAMARAMENLRNQGWMPEVEAPAIYNQMHAQDKHTPMPVNVLNSWDEELEFVSKSKPVKFKARYKLSDEQKGGIKAEWDGLGAEEKEALRPIEFRGKLAGMSEPSAAMHAWYLRWRGSVDGWEEWTEEEQNDWYGFEDSFMQYIGKILPAIDKALEDAKPYIGEDGLVDRPSTFHEEQARDLAEHEQFVKEQEAKRLEAAALKEKEKAAKKAERELERAHAKLVKAEQEHRAVVQNLRQGAAND